jgi:hypothetical protein
MAFRLDLRRKRFKQNELTRLLFKVEIYNKGTRCMMHGILMSCDEGGGGGGGFGGVRC